MNIQQLAHAEHTKHVYLWALYYEKKLWIDRPREEVKALETRIRNGISVVFDDAWKYAQVDRNNPNK